MELRRNRPEAAKVFLHSLRGRLSLGSTDTSRKRRLALPLSLLSAILWAAPVYSWAQDPVRIDPAHYKVEFENQHIRVLRFRLGPREKSPMHEHPARITTNLTSGRSRVTLADGRSQDLDSKAGEVAWRPPIRHAVENLTDKPLETVSTELKPVPVVKPAVKSVSKRKATVRKKPPAKRVVKRATRAKSRTPTRRRR